MDTSRSFAPDEDFAYSNSGYVLLALLAERAAGTPFHDLVIERVCARAGMWDTAFLRSDELPRHTALGYLDPTDCGRTSFTFRCEGRAMAACTRPRRTCERCRRP